MNRLTYRQLIFGCFVLAALAGWSFAGTVVLNAGDNANQKLAALQPGDTVQVNTGTFNVTSTITPPTGVKFVGLLQGKCWFKTVNDRQFAFKLADGRTLSFSNIGFDGGAIGCEGTSTLNVDWCEFTNFDRAPNGAFGGGLAVGSGGHGGGWKAKGFVKNSLFRDGGGPNTSGRGWCLGWYTCDGFSVWNNEFINVMNALKADNGSDTGHNYARKLSVIGNYFSRVRRMAAEFQGGCEGFDFFDNFYELPLMSSNQQSNLSTFAYSIIFNGQRNRDCVVERNVVHGLPLINADNGSTSQTRIDVAGVRIAFEVGNNFTVRDNLAHGLNSLLQAYMNETTVRPPAPFDPSLIGPTVCENNRFWDGGGAYAHGAHKDRFTARNNNQNVQLTWDINRGRPLRGGGFAGGPTPPPTTQPIPPIPPVPTPAKGVVGVVANVAGHTTAKLSWENKGITPTSIRVEIVSTRGGERFPSQTFGGAQNGATVQPLHPGWELDLTVVAITAEGEFKSAPVTVRMTGDPNAPFPPTTTPPIPPTTQPIPPVPTDDPITEVRIQQKSGKTTTVKP